MVKSKLIIRLEYILLRIAESLNSFLSLFQNNIFLLTVSNLLFYILVPIRTISKQNLELAFPNYSKYSIKQIQLHCFKHLLTTTFEIFSIEHVYQKQFNNWIQYSTGSKELIEKAYKSGRGILIVTGHYGNWELLALAIAKLKKPFNIIYRPLDNPLIDKYIYEIREKYPANLIKREDTMKLGIPALNRGEILAITIDQNQKTNSIFVPFFNHLAATAKGAAILARRTNAEVFMGYIHRNENLTHTVTFDPLTCSKTPSVKKDILENTTLFTQTFEKIVINEPKQWFWFHPRWKSRPINPIKK